MRRLLPLRFVPALALAIALPAFAQAPAPTREGQDAMSLLVRFLTGTFESVRQEERLGSNLAMKVRFLPLWPERVAQGEYWLYEEVVETEPKEKVVEQRVLRLTEAGGVIHAVPHDLPGNPSRYAGEWRKAKPFAALKPGQLVARSGCDIEFIMQMISLFNGAQRTATCPSRVKAGTHHHVEMYVSSTSMRRWEVDRDAAGEVVAGPPKPVEMRRISATPG